ncbi:hypothetical protein [Rugamonas rubra]|uniref:Uncharacterized protein n=1 Tax=Rugamonas rubra TaxID=758825 RepID=A0A1I4JC57_9BURK|nr:hypothetical protein [Rugamonas rubra]SFL63847.1 hypothetical protein SAMN02982985_00904 [Rugamonas rubra]
MPSLLTQTRKQLSELNSPDEFEALATAVLREADPAYASLLHVGTNVNGRTVRSPVDGIDIRIHRGARRLLLVQHTITARNGLRRKWLDEKEGDIAKAKIIFGQEVSRGTVLDATLVLTSTFDPDEKLIRDVHAAAGEGMRVDLWPASRIADFLDRNPEGQWLRKEQFGTEAVRISASQARAISRQSLDGYLPLVERGDTVPRLLGTALAEFTCQSRGAGFVIGESGLGKSTALRRLGDEWFAQGGIAIVLAHECIEQAATIEQATALGLRHWAPALDLGCGHAALALATPDQPILLIVEDVNRSTNPRRIIERLVGWSVAINSVTNGDALARQWRILCPVWRGNAGLADKELGKRVLRNSFMVDRFERTEAVEAVRTRALGAGVEFTALQCNDLATALGDDPLLIGLNSDWSAPSPQGAIQSYLAANINEAADDGLLSSDLQYALDELAERMVEARTIYPTWHQIRRWLADEGDTLAAIRRLISQGRILRLDTSSNDELLVYRHDRVRDYLLTQAMKRLIGSDRLTTELWTEPFYAALIGGALEVLPETVISEAANRNPVALFAALQSTSLNEGHRRRLVEAAEGWIVSSGFDVEAARQQRHHAMQYLARTDAAFAADLAQRFPFSFLRLEALVRNGNVEAGATLCANSEPGVNDAWRDRIISHALSRHANFVPDLAELIRNGNFSPKLLEGALNLAGEIGDSTLCDALAAHWARGDGTSLSVGWLWAALRCCPPIDHPLAGTLCDIWAELPTKVKQSAGEPDHNPRWDIAGYELPWAFSRKAESSTIAFLVARAKRDRKLNHVLNSILLRIDTPDAVLYSVQQGAKIYRRTELNGGVNLFAQDLERTWSPEQHGRALSARSRTAVERIWRNRRINRFERKTAFLIWCQTPTRDDLADLATLEVDPVLADAALRTRLAAGDQLAVPLLKQRIWSTERGQYWWFHARRVGLINLHEDVQHYLDKHRADPSVADTYVDRTLAELLMEENNEFATQTIVGNWNRIKTSPSFIHAALYLATEETVALARSAISNSATPEKILEHIDRHWGIRTTGRAGVIDLAQLKALEPYYAQMRQMERGDMLIGSFFDAANGLDALSWREKHLDPLIASTDRRHCTSDKQTLFASLDGETKSYLKYDRHWFSIDQWFERREEELWKRSSLLTIVGEWASSRANETAVALLCEALLYFGERRDIALFSSLLPALRETCADMIANCVYDVRRRSLSST